MSDAYDLYQEGRARLREGMAAQATVALERAKRLEPEKASIREALGIAYYRITRWDAAEAEFRKVIELSPVDAYAHFALGRSLEKQGRTDEASRYLKLASVLERRPDAPTANDRDEDELPLDLQLEHDEGGSPPH